MKTKKVDYSELTDPNYSVMDSNNYDELTDPNYQEEENISPSFMQKLPRNIAAGLAEMGHEVANTPYKISKAANKAFGNEESLAAKLGIKPSDIPHFGEQDFGQMFGLPKEQTMADKLIRGAAQYIPGMALPAANIGKAGAALSKVPGVGKFLKRTAEIGLPQAGFSATQTENPLTGAAEGLAVGGLGAGIERGVNALRPSQMLRGNLSPEQLAKNLEATEGTETGLGRVIESPSLNRMYENILPHIVGSGAESAMQRTASKITNKGENLLEKFKGSLDSGKTGMQLQEALKKAASDARNEKNAGFEKLNKIADEAGLKVGRENFQSAANRTLEDIAQSPELKSEFSGELLKDLQRYAKNPEGNNLKLTNIFRGKLGDKANELYQAGKMHEYGIVNGLKESLSKDIEHAFEKSGNKELKSAYEQNQKNYAEKFAQFEDPDIVKFTRRGGDPDLLLSHFLKGGSNDRATLLKKLASKLPKEESNQIPYAYLSRAVDKNGQFDPVKLSTLYRNLGENQKKVLFPNAKVRKEIENYSNLVGKNTEAFDLMRNPKTGARNTELLAKIAQLMGAGSIGGTTGLASIVGTGVAARIAKKGLTSEKLRKSIVKAMIKNKDMEVGRVIPGIMTMELNNYKGEE